MHMETHDREERQNWKEDAHIGTSDKRHPNTHSAKSVFKRQNRGNYSIAIVLGVVLVCAPFSRKVDLFSVLLSVHV